MTEMKNPNGQIFNIENHRVSEMLALGWTLVDNN